MGQDEVDQPFPNGSPKDADSREVIDILTKRGLWYRKKAAPRAHPLGFLKCKNGNCRLTVYSTPRGNQARVLWNLARKCPHGSAPNVSYQSRKKFR